MTIEKAELLSLLPQELEDLMAELGEPKYRADQMFPQLHRGVSPEEMTNLGKALRQKLSDTTAFHLPQIEKKLISALETVIGIFPSLIVIL